jgi:hypothetical protein
MKSSRVVVATLVSAALAGCGGVKVRQSSSQEALRLEAKPSDCDLDYYPRPPKRAYQEIAELTTYETIPFQTPEVLREQACALGADAIIEVRNFVTNELGHKVIAGVAIRYTTPPPAAAQGSAGSI